MPPRSRCLEFVHQARGANRIAEHELAARQVEEEDGQFGMIGCAQHRSAFVKEPMAFPNVARDSGYGRTYPQSVRFELGHAQTVGDAGEFGSDCLCFVMTTHPGERQPKRP